MQRCFVAYLASHNRPVHEMLAPTLKDVSATWECGFEGMARDAVDLNTLLAARKRLLSELPQSLCSAERQFLLSLAAAEPEWKLQNLQTLAKKNPAKFRSQQAKLAELLKVWTRRYTGASEHPMIEKGTSSAASDKQMETNWCHKRSLTT
jgi:hypothetical protein